MEDWWRLKEHRLREALNALRQKKVITVVEDVFSFVPENDIPGVNLIHKNHSYFDEHGSQADIFFNQGYDDDLDALWRVIKTGRAGVTSCWFWDNHHLQKTTMRGSMLADVTFCAHSYAAHYQNELGHYGGFVPLCGPFWGNLLSKTILAECKGRARSNLVYGGFNSYTEFPERDNFLEKIKLAFSEHCIRQWPHGTPWAEHGYYSLSHADKLREWCGYKIALCVSFGLNSTMRMLEALVAGQIPLVVGAVADLDLIISPEEQIRLPVIRVVDNDVAQLQHAYREALAQFDGEGEMGIERRSTYALERHMPRNRLVQMIEAIRALPV